jgi:Anti-sigma-K factor rskA
MGKRQLPGDEVQWPPSRPAEPRPAGGGAQPSRKNPWYRRVSFWRSVAGMAIAIALGSAAVAMETTSELSSRTMFFHHRVELLLSRIAGLRAEAAEAERQLAALQAERINGASINRVLSANDVVTLRLTPGAGSNAHGLLALSRQAGAAIVEIAGLPRTDSRSCVIWWLLAKRPPIKAIELDLNADGWRSQAIPLPPHRERVNGVIVTLESGKPGNKPEGGILLKGVLPGTPMLS